MKQKVFNALSTVILMTLLCWTIKQYYDLKTTRETLASVKTQTQLCAQMVNDLSSSDSRRLFDINKLEERLANVENGWYQFLDLMYKEPQAE